jgi:Spy/CpxP family protein refolding chaperone
MAKDLLAALEPLREAEKANRDALRTALQSDNPDATEIGRLVLDGRDVGEEIRDQMRAFADDFRDILDAEQQVKWDNFLELRRLQQRGPGAKIFRRRG